MVASTGTTGKAKTTKAAVRRIKEPPLDVISAVEALDAVEAVVSARGTP